MKLEGLILVASFFYLGYTQQVKGQTRENCKTSCGNVTIEFPFGILTGCYYDKDPSFKLTCDEEEKLLFNGLQVVNISHSSQLRILFPPSYVCFNGQGFIKGIHYYTEKLGNLTLSDDNVLTVVGCNAYAFVNTAETLVGCMSECDAKPLLENRECNGEGCCQNPVAAGSSVYIVKVYRATKDTMESVVRPFSSPCVYAFLAENGTFKYNSLEDHTYLQTSNFPVVLDWSIRGETCGQAGNLCRTNSICSNSTGFTGYVCNCEDGYHGNPYLPKGCQDINECTSGRDNCFDHNTCENMPGSFYCKCPSGSHLNTTDMRCMPNGTPAYVEWTTIFLGTTIGFLVILLVVSCAQQRMKHRKNTELRQQFFEQNGGGMLVQRLSGAGPSNVDVKIFTEEGMKTATDDPEYYNTGLLNEKSDVYSFGVVLMELLSGQKALCFERPQNSKHLVSYFACAMKEQRLHEVIDGQVWNEDNQREIQEVARVSVECTRVTGEERPRMKEVAAELEALRATKTKHKWSEHYSEPEESNHLLGVEILSAQGDTSSTGYDSIKNVARLDIEAGR
ncbi:unnamed protein product [Thlaspi arvense]|uniref:EGF-like domain-containing protein n=1 Tax=Thlaspi arvense TaxID=13288 RepID=A0AAU9REW0_THLAR|nr:unnamed protein product [Thlaspi arvense]